MGSQLNNKVNASASRRADSDSDSGKPKEKLPCVSEFPATIAEIRKHDPAVDEAFVRGLSIRAVQHCMSAPSFPPETLEKITDKVLARAVAESFATGPPKHRAGLLLNRVPNILVAWAVEDKAEEERKNGSIRRGSTEINGHNPGLG